MVCFLCLAAAAALGAALLGPDAIAGLKEKLDSMLGNIRATSESDSVVRLEGDYSLKRGRSTVPIPTAVYLYKKHQRLRIQILTHDISNDEAERVQDAIAEALGVSIVARSFPESVHLDDGSHLDRQNWALDPLEANPVAPEQIPPMQTP